jgi:mRNA interferase RelE/StbE
MSWDYRIDELALEDMRDMGPSAAGQIRDYLDKRIRGCADPRAFGKPLRGDKHGLWRYRVRDYRLICEIQDDALIVLLVHAAHRSTVYD